MKQQKKHINPEWHNALRDAFRQSSPEAFAVSQESGALDAHINNVMQFYVPSGKDSDQAHFVQQLLPHVVKIDQGPVAEAISRKPIFSENASAWRKELDAYLRGYGPESYAQAKKLGRLHPHIDKIIVLAEQELERGQTEGLPRAKCTHNAIRLLTERAAPIPMLPEEIFQEGAEQRFLDVANFHVLQDWYAISDQEERNKLSEQMMGAITFNEGYGKLLAHPVFAHEFGGTPLYLQAMGAYFASRGDLAGAHAVLNELVQKFPSDFNYVLLTNLLRMQGKWKEALEVAERGIQSLGSTGKLPLIASSVAYAMGEVKRANALIAPVREAFFRNFPRKEYIAERAAELKEVMAENKLYRDKELDVYNENFTRNTWWNYWYHFNGYSKHQHSEGVLGEMVPEVLGEFLGTNGRNIPHFFELGTMCGEPLYRLAKRYPHMRFTGVDRAAIVKQLNDKAYHLPNMEFLAADIFDCLNEAQDTEGAMLFHVRTAPFLFPAFLEKLYKTCYDAGFKYIGLLEVYPISYTQQCYRSFDEMQEAAEIRGGGLIHHNYPAHLRKAGFKIAEQRVLPSTLLNANGNNSVLIIGERV